MLTKYKDVKTRKRAYIHVRGVFGNFFYQERAPNFVTFLSVVFFGKVNFMQFK